MDFEDHFSKQSNDYVKYRPCYPFELYTYLASLTSEHELAIDCATGNGQAALGLTKHFNKVVAVDPSQTQLSNAVANPQIEYKLGTAENLPQLESSADIVVAASGLHWFDTEKFYDQVKKVIVPGGVLAAWAYYGWSGRSEVADIIYDFEQNILGPYWPKPFQKDMRSHYLNLPFPFEEIKAPEFMLPTLITKDQVRGYLKTFSASQIYLEKNGIEAVSLVENKLSQIFKGTETLDLTWNMVLRVGRLGSVR